MLVLVGGRILKTAVPAAFCFAPPKFWPRKFPGQPQFQVSEKLPSCKSNRKTKVTLGPKIDIFCLEKIYTPVI